MFSISTGIICRPKDINEGDKEAVFGLASHELNILLTGKEAVVIDQKYGYIFTVKAANELEAAAKYIDYFYDESDLWLRDFEDGSYYETDELVKTSEWYEYDYIVSNLELVEGR